MSKEKLIELLVEDIGDNGQPRTLVLQKDMEEKLELSKTTVGKYLTKIYEQEDITLPEGENRYRHLPLTDFSKDKVAEKRNSPENKKNETLKIITEASSGGAATGAKDFLDKEFGTRVELKKQTDKANEQTDKDKKTFKKIAKVLGITFGIALIFIIINLIIFL